MTRIMRDSTTAADIPLRGLDLAAGYSNGRFAWTPADWGRFAGIPHAVIDVNGTDPAGCGVLDVETGDATPAEAAAWVRARRALHPGAYAVVYVNRSNITAVFNAMGAAGLHVGRDFHTWVATLDGTKLLADMTGVVAVQYAGQQQTGGHYDESVVYDPSWHAVAPPVPPPPAQLDGEVVWLQGGTLHARGVVSADAGKSWQ